MLKTLYILLVCYLPIVEPFIPKTKFGAGMPDIGATRLLSYFLVLTFLFLSAIRFRIKLYNKWIIILATYSIFVVASVSWSNYYAYNVTLIQFFFNTLIMPLIIAVIAFNLFETDANIDFYIKHLLIAAAILSFIAILQSILGSSIVGGFRRSVATFENPNALAIFLVLAIPCLNYATDKRLFNQNLMWLIMALIIAAVIATVSRKGIITGTMAFFLYYVLRRNYRKALVIGITALILAGIFSQVKFISVRFESKFMEHSLEKKASHREIGMRMFATSPIIGHGYRGYYEQYGDYIGQPGRKYDPHNIFISALTSYGLIGFIFFLGVFIYPVYYSLKIILKKGKKDFEGQAYDMAIICITTIIPFMINGFYSGRLFYKPVMLFILYTQIVFVFQNSGFKKNNKEKVNA
jgi:O-antigen ligase